MMAAPLTLFDVQRSANEHMDENLRGFRAVQVRAYYRSRRENGLPDPTYGEVTRDLDFYDRAGAYRAAKRLKDRGEI